MNYVAVAIYNYCSIIVWMNINNISTQKVAHCARRVHVNDFDVLNILTKKLISVRDKFIVLIRMETGLCEREQIRKGRIKDGPGLAKN